MADPYTPFGYAPPPTLGGPPRRMRSLAEMGFTPPQFATAEGGLMPQSPEEAMDLQQQGQGMASMATMAAPFALAGPIGLGARSLASLAAMYPRAATAAAGGGALFGEATAAGPAQKSKEPQKAVPKANPKPPSKPAAPEGADPALQRLLDSDPVLRSLRKSIDEQDAIANAQAGNDPAAGTYPKSTRDGARARSADLTKEFNARLMELSRANLPFDQAYPWLAQNRGLVSFLAPAGVGYGTRMAGNLLSRVGPARYERALRGADRALERGDDKAYGHYMTRASRFEPREPSTLSRVGHATMPAVAGGTVGAELSMLPYQHNITNAPLGSPQRAEAEAFLSDPMQWGPRAAFGFGIGALGGATGGHFPNVGPGFRPPPSGPTPAAPLPPTMGATPAVPLPPAAGTARALPQPPLSMVPPAPLQSTPASGAMWPAPPAVSPGPPPGLASIQSPRPSGPSPTDAPPMPQSAVNAPARPMPPGAYQDASGRWRVGNRWITNPDK